MQACAPTPVTAKIRLGCTRDEINAIDVAQVVEAAGGAALTVHGRTAPGHLPRPGRLGSDRGDQAAPEADPADRQRRPGFAPRRCSTRFARYGVDGVMIARAALGRPWLFRQVQAALRGEPIPPDPTLAEQRDVLLQHYRLVVERFGDERGRC